MALLLMGQQRSERKRAQLRTWAWASAGWIAVQIVIAIALYAAVSSGSTSIDRSGPCVGGPEIGATAYQQDDGSFVFPCAISGTETQRGP